MPPSGEGTQLLEINEMEPWGLRSNLINLRRVCCSVTTLGRRYRELDTKQEIHYVCDMPFEKSLLREDNKSDQSYNMHFRKVKLRGIKL